MGNYNKVEVLAQLQAIENNSGIDVNNDGNDNPQINAGSAGTHQARLEALLCIVAGLLADTSGTGGGAPVDTARNVYSDTEVTTGAWTQLVAALPDDVGEIYVFDSSGQTMELGIGAAGHEVPVVLLPPGGLGGLGVSFEAGTRISIRAVSADATAGEIDINFLS